MNQLNFISTKAFREINDRMSQKDFYIKNNASNEILKLVDLESKSFGTTCEKIIIELFKLEKRTSSENDCRYNEYKIEIKSARYWVSTDLDCKWQHIEPDYDYSYIIFSLLDFKNMKFFILNKNKLLLLKEIGILTKQGKQGYWMNLSKSLKYLFEMKTIEDLEYYIRHSEKI
jgi:hypothetical protein